MSIIDRKFDKLGFDLDHENKYGVYYKHDLGPYTHVIAILHKTNGDGTHGYLIQSYQGNINTDGLNNMVAMSEKELKLALKKLKQFKRKYGKEWRKA